MVHATFSRTPEQLDELLRTGSGSLSDTPYAILLLAFARSEASGLLTLHRNPLQKEIAFDAGSPVDCQSNIATETLGRFLVSSGKLSERDGHAAMALAASRGVAIEEILLEQKLIDRTELDRASQQSLGRKLLEPFSWKSGSWEISLESAPAGSSLRVKVPQLILTGALKVETQEHVDDVLEPARDHYLAIADVPLFPLEEIRLTEEQRKIVEAARRRAPLAEVAGEEDARRLLYALLTLGVLTVVDTPAAIPPVAVTLPDAAPMFELENPFASDSSLLPPIELPPVMAAAPAPAPTPAPVAGVPPAPKDEVLATHRTLRERDAFQLLGVGESDGPLQFQRAFLAIADRFLPSKFDERAPDGLREKAQEVFLAAARAYAELMDPMRREALRATRAARPAPPPVVSAPPRPAPPAAPPPPPVAKPLERKPMKAAIIDPEALCRNGRELAEQGKLREALSSFELAAECDAQNGTYAAEVAWCRFQLHVSPATTTLKMLKNAIRIDPRSGLAHLYAARVAAVLGNRSEASALLDRAAMLMPRDLRVVEALKALR